MRMTLAKNNRYYIVLAKKYKNVLPGFYDNLNISITYTVDSLLPVIILTPSIKINVEINAILAIICK